MYALTTVNIFHTKRFAKMTVTTYKKMFVAGNQYYYEVLTPQTEKYY